jgi:hypothetical protein
MGVGSWLNNYSEFSAALMGMHNAYPTSTGELAKAESINRRLSVLIHGDLALAHAIGAGLSTVRTWRAKRLIPYIKTGHKSITYNLSKVLAALEALEVKAIIAKGTR